MEWIIAAVIGGWGGGWSRLGYEGEGWERNPPWCWACMVVIGAVVAVIIEAVVAPHLANMDGLGRALVNFGSGVSGALLVGGVLDMARGNKGRTNS